MAGPAEERTPSLPVHSHYGNRTDVFLGQLARHLRPQVKKLAGLLLQRLNGDPSHQRLAHDPPGHDAAGRARVRPRGPFLGRARPGARRSCPTTELVVSELVTNAIRYGKSPVELRLIFQSTRTCEVSPTTAAPPCICAAPGSSTKAAGACSWWPSSPNAGGRDTIARGKSSGRSRLSQRAAGRAPKEPDQLSPRGAETRFAQNVRLTGR